METIAPATPPRRLRVRFGNTTREQAIEQAWQQLRRRDDEAPGGDGKRRRTTS